MDELYRSGPGLYELADEGTMLCRCEEITVGEALEAIGDGAAHVNEVKAWTRAGWDDAKDACAVPRSRI